MKAENIKTVAVIGAGAMGQQIAMNTALNGREKGYKVILCDSFPAAIEKATKWAADYLAGRVAKGRLTQEEAESVRNALREKGIEADLLTKDSMKFRTGISVMPFYLAKGLEFDAVYIPNVQKYHSPLEKQAMYINVTRALHKLKLYILLT